MPPQNLEALLARETFPGQAPAENGIIHDWLVARGAEYDGIEFSVHVGQGQQPNLEHLPAIQAMTRFVTQKRVDAVARRGNTFALVEVKERINPGVLGQLRTYRQLYLEDHPDVDEVALLAIGRRSDPDTLRVLSAEGVDVLLYESEQDASGVAAGGL